MPLIDPIELLRREDKWYLGNGGMLLYAPPFPQYLRTPGVWDECHYGDLAVPRLLCLSFALEVPADGGAAVSGRQNIAGRDARATESGQALLELEPHLTTWQWYPDRIEARYYLVRRDGLGYKQQYGQRIFLLETRRIAPDGTLSCALRFETMKDLPPATLHIVAWTARQRGSSERAEAHSDFAYDGTALGYTQAVASRAHARGAAALPLQITMQGSRKPTSAQVTPSHGANLVPRLPYTPLWDELKHGKLSGEIVGENVLGSVVYAGLHWKFKVSPQSVPKLDVQVSVRAGGRPSLAAQLASDAVKQERAVTPALPEQPAGTRALPAWREFLALVPHFECSDEMLTRYYWYRWYGLRLNAVPRGGNYVAPGVTEGIAYFRGVITYSLMCHMQECKWLADPALAQGCLRNHIAHQTKAGHFPGHIYVNHVNDAGFYHTDVGGATAALLMHHPDRAFAEEVHKPLSRLLRYYTGQRDAEALALYDVRDQFETGQEFSSRYFHADQRADLYGWEHKLKLKGVDVTYYVYRLARFLEKQAQLRGARAEARRLGALSERIRGAVQERMWDRRRGFFFDYSAERERKSPYWVAVGLYPLLCDLATPDQALAAARQLLPGGKFATPWPTPTVAVDDPHFAADPRWRGERANCPWNGRVWPMVNSHVVDVLGALAELQPDLYRPQLASYLRRYIAMMHFEQYNSPRVGAVLQAAVPADIKGVQPEPAAPPVKDFTRPNCFEHYHPYDGTACEYRGIDDYMHSWVVDLLLKYVAGVRLEGTQARPCLVVDPLPFGLDSFLLRGCALRGHKLDVCWNRERRGGAAQGFYIYLDGRLAHRAPQPERWEVAL